MLPKWHLFFGFLFTYLIYWFTSLTTFQASLIFLSSVLIDFDHYIFIMKRKKIFNLKKAYFWNKNLPDKHKPIMQIFHTIEFLAFTFILTFFWEGFLFILIGMLFHSILDIIYLFNKKAVFTREFSFIKYLISDKTKYF